MVIRSRRPTCVSEPMSVHATETSSQAIRGEQRQHTSVLIGSCPWLRSNCSSQQTRALSESIRKHGYPCSSSCLLFPAAASHRLEGLSTVYRAAAPFKGFHYSRFKETIFTLFMSATLPYFGESSEGGSANVSLKCKEDGSELGNYGSWNYSHYIFLILCGILLQVGMCREAVSICTSTSQRQVP